MPSVNVYVLLMHTLELWRATIKRMVVERADQGMIVVFAV